MSFPRLTAEEAAAYIADGQTVGFSGFTPAGAAKVPAAASVPARDAEGQLGIKAARRALELDPTVNSAPSEFAMRASSASAAASARRASSILSSGARS